MATYTCESCEETFNGSPHTSRSGATVCPSCDDSPNTAEAVQANDATPPGRTTSQAGYAARLSHGEPPR